MCVFWGLCDRLTIVCSHADRFHRELNSLFEREKKLPLVKASITKGGERRSKFSHTQIETSRVLFPQSCLVIPFSLARHSCQAICPIAHLASCYSPTQEPKVTLLFLQEQVQTTPPGTKESFIWLHHIYLISTSSKHRSSSKTLK